MKPDDPPGSSRGHPRVAGDVLRVSRGLTISLSEIEWRFSTSGGPGGQHANRASTRVEARFNVARSSSIGPRQRARLVERLGECVRVVVSEERSQLRNREIAMERLAERLAAALKVTVPRRPTQPSAAARQRRLEGKRRRSELKQSRSRGVAEER